MIIDIPFYIFVIFIIVILLGIGISFLGYFTFMLFKKVRKTLKFVADCGMDIDDLDERIDRRFVLLLKSDELFKSHIEKRIMNEKKGE